MMNKALIISIWILLIGATPSYAQWSKETQDIVHSSNRSQALLFGALSSMLPGLFINKIKLNGCYNMIEGSVKGIVQTNADVFNVNPLEFDRKKVNIFIRFPNEQQIQLHVSKKHFKANNGIFKAHFWSPTALAPAKGKKLAVYLPGIFQGTFQFFTYQATHLLSENGFTVLVIPNSMSAEYLTQRPTDSMGSFEQEAQVVLDAIRSFKQQYPDVTSVDLPGASYGGYLAAVVAALDAQSKNPVIDRQTTLIGPIYSMKAAADYLDPLMDTSLPLKSSIEKEMEKEISWESIARNLHLIPELGPCKAVGLMFHESLVQLSMNIKTNFNIDRDENFKNRNYQRISQEVFAQLSPYNSEYLEKIRFNSLIANLTPENKAYYESEKDNLSYWFNLAAANNNTRLRIVIGSNDFLSPGALLNKLPQWAKKNDHIQFTVMGGHNGFIFDDWFREFVAAAYR